MSARRPTPYRHTVKRRYFRGDAAFANPEIYALLEAGAYKYTIRLFVQPTNTFVERRYCNLVGLDACTDRLGAHIL